MKMPRGLTRAPATSPQSGVLASTEFTFQVWQLRQRRKRGYRGISGTHTKLVGLAGHVGIASLMGAEAKVEVPDSFVYVQRWKNDNMELGPQVVWDSIQGSCHTDLHRDVVRILREG